MSTMFGKLLNNFKGSNFVPVGAKRNGEPNMLCTTKVQSDRPSDIQALPLSLLGRLGQQKTQAVINTVDDGCTCYNSAVSDDARAHAMVAIAQHHRSGFPRDDNHFLSIKDGSTLTDHNGNEPFPSDLQKIIKLFDAADLARAKFATEALNQQSYCESVLSFLQKLRTFGRVEEYIAIFRQQFSFRSSSSVNRRTDSCISREELFVQLSSTGILKRPASEVEIKSPLDQVSDIMGFSTSSKPGHHEWHGWYDGFVKSSHHLTSKGVLEHYFQLLKEAQCDSGLEVLCRVSVSTLNKHRQTVIVKRWQSVALKSIEFTEAPHSTGGVHAHVTVEVLDSDCEVKELKIPLDSLHVGNVLALATIHEKSLNFLNHLMGHRLEADRTLDLSTDQCNTDKHLYAAARHMWSQDERLTALFTDSDADQASFLVLVLDRLPRALGLTIQKAHALVREVTTSSEPTWDRSNLVLTLNRVLDRVAVSLRNQCSCVVIARDFHDLLITVRKQGESAIGVKQYQGIQLMIDAFARLTQEATSGDRIITPGYLVETISALLRWLQAHCAVESSGASDTSAQVPLKKSKSESSKQAHLVGATNTDKPAKQPKSCETCNNSFTPKRDYHKFCPACNKARVESAEDTAASDNGGSTTPTKSKKNKGNKGKPKPKAKAAAAKAAKPSTAPTSTPKAPPSPAPAKANVAITKTATISLGNVFGNFVNTGDVYRAQHNTDMLTTKSEISEKQRMQLAGLLEAYSTGQTVTGDHFLNIGKLRAMLSDPQTDFLTIKDGGQFIPLQVGNGDGYLCCDLHKLATGSSTPFRKFTKKELNTASLFSDSGHHLL